MAKDERKLTGLLAALNKYKYVLLVAVIGAALLLWPGTKPETADLPAGGGPAAGEAELAKTEAAMEEILGKIGGVGRVDVMLTLQSGSELVLAEDSSLRYSGDSRSPDSYERSSQPVTDSGGVRLQVISAVSALTGLGSDRIAVVKWSEAELPAKTAANKNQTIGEENKS